MRPDTFIRCALALAFVFAGSGWLTTATAQQKVAQEQPVLSTLDGRVQVFSDQLAATPRQAQQSGALTLDVNGATTNGSYVSGDPSNTVVELDIGAGNTLTGIGWEINVEAFDPSWRSESSVAFTADPDSTTGLFLSVGAADNSPGVTDYSSDGVLLLADAGIDPVPAGDDGLFYLTWHESFNDGTVDPDSEQNGSTMPMTLPPGYRLVCSDQAACDAAVEAANGGAGGDQASLPIDFEDENVDYELVDFGGNASQLIADPTDATNTVVESVRTEGAECFAGTTVSNARGFAEPIPFSEGNTKMNVRVWSPQAGVRVLFKVEKFDDPTINVETFSFTTVAEQWETIEFDFANPMPNTNPINFGNEYSKASIFFDFQCNLPPTGTTPSTYYWDDVAFGPADMGDMTIAEARAAGAGATVTVQGTVSRAKGDFAYIQDETAGLTIRQTGGAFFDDVADGTITEGTTLEVTGTLSEFANLLQINEGDLDSYMVLGNEAPPAPQVVTLQNLVDSGEEYEAELVQVADLTIDGMGMFAASTSYTVTDPTASDTLRVPNADDSDVDGTMIPDGEFTFTGVIGQFSFDGPGLGYQLLAINEGDVEAQMGGGDQASLPIDFEDENVDYELVDFGGNASQLIADPTDATNTVVESVRTEGAECFAGTTVSNARGFAEPIPFSEGNTKMNVRVWSPQAGVRVLFKVEKFDDPTINVETFSFTTVAEQWETIEFDFANPMPNTNPINFGNEYSKASIFFDFQCNLPPTGTTPSTYYWDDVAFGPAGNGGDISFSPSPLLEMLSVGETGTETVTLTNNSDGDVAFDFSQYSDDAPPPSGTVASPYGEFAGESLNLAKGEADMRAGEGQRFGEGGPDAFGYRWIDSNEPGGPSFDFVDISGTGTATALGDDAVTTVALPFTFSFYGQDYDEIVISSNGFLSFDPDAGSDLSNDPIPSAGGTENLIAALWDDLDPGNGDGAPGEIYYQDMGDGRFIVQYDMVPHWPDGDAELNTFEIILNQSGSILLQYSSFTDDASGPESYTVGIENADGTDGLQVAFNEAYLEDGLAVLISARPSFVTGVTPATGTIPAGGTADVDVDFSAEGLVGGIYEGALTVETDLASDPSTFELPVVLEVGGMAACALTAETITFEDTIIGNSSSEDATVMNGGTDSCELTDASADGPFSVEGFTAGALAPGESSTFSVVYTPTEAGDDTGTLTVDLANKDDLTAALEGSALDAPTPEVDTEALSFTVEEGDTDSGSFTLSNVGGENAADLEYSISVAEALLAARATQEAPVSGARPGAVLRSGESAHRIVPKTLPEGPFAQTSEAGSGEEIVQDGSFEAGTPNPSWTEFSATFGTPLCDTATCGTGGGTGPFDGNWWAWFGGTAAGDEGSVEQEVEIPSGSAMLSFYLEIPVEVDAPGSMTVLMDGDELFSVTEADQATYATYQQVMIDVSDYADGGTHTLRFESTTSANGNFFIDLVSIVSTGPALVSVAPESGSIAPGESEEIAVTVNAAEVDPGTYEFNLAIATNDPSNPTVTIPVTVVVEPAVSNEQDGVPTEFALGQNYPNPFASRTTIDYALPQAARVTITVYDAVGRQVAVLVDKDLTSGFHTAEWDTRGLASGVYLYRIQAGDYTKTRKMSIVR